MGLRNIHETRAVVDLEANGKGSNRGNRMSDPINPKHYKHLPAEAIDIIEAAIEGAPSNKVACLHWQTLKYLLRCWEKKGIEDLREAKWYLDRLVNEFDDLLAEINAPILNGAIEQPKPSKTQPPTGYRLLGPAKDHTRFAFDLYWSISAGNWTPLLLHQVEYANRDNWPACREIEKPVDDPAPWTPKVGDWVKVTKPVDCVPAHKIWWVKDMDQFDGQVMKVTSVNPQSPWANLDGLSWDFDFAWLSPAEYPRFKPAPKPSRTQPPVGWRWLEAGEVICDGDRPVFPGGDVRELYAPNIGQRYKCLTRAHCRFIRKIETPSNEPTANPQGMLPPSDCRWIKCGETLIDTDEFIRRDSHRDTIAIELVGEKVEVGNLFIRKIETPSESLRFYREPTQADLANGPVCCEVRDWDSEQWKARQLIQVHEFGPFRFLCKNESCDNPLNWNQCRIEVTE